MTLYLSDSTYLYLTMPEDSFGATTGRKKTVFLFSLIMYLTLGRVKAIFFIRITFILPFFQVKFMSISIKELVREAAKAG